MLTEVQTMTPILLFTSSGRQETSDVALRLRLEKPQRCPTPEHAQLPQRPREREEHSTGSDFNPQALANPWMARRFSTAATQGASESGVFQRLDGPLGTGLRPEGLVVPIPGIWECWVDHLFGSSCQNGNCFRVSYPARRCVGKVRALQDDVSVVSSNCVAKQSGCITLEYPSHQSGIPNVY